MSDAYIQSAGFLLELSPDWLILRASENTHGFLGEYHQRMVGEPLARFTLAQSLHDLRNSLARQRSSIGVARAYRVRLIDEPRYFDIAFQSSDSVILLEGLPSREDDYGEWLGSVSRLIDGLAGGTREAMLEGAARRMRALTGFDRVKLTIDDDVVVSSRGRLPELVVSGDLPAIVANSADGPLALFPREGDDDVASALLRSPSLKQLEELRTAGVASTLCVPVTHHGELVGHFLCDNRLARPPSFEQHAAAELFAQMVGLLLPE